MWPVPEFRGDGIDDASERVVRLFLCGDVMTGRGVDQILGHPCEPTIHESYMQSALGYVELVERVSGPVARPVDDAYVWGDALAELARARPDARIINLETSVTRSEAWEPKGINYRMNPANIGVLSAANIDCCVLANNHVLDYGVAGLSETLAALRGAGIATAGAGSERAEAWRPAVLPVRGGRVLVFAFGHGSSGIPPDWAAEVGRPGVARVPDLREETAREIAAAVQRAKRPGDVVVASIHWGGNWGYEVPDEQTRFAHLLVSAGVDVVHGHSSHHPRPIEVREGRLIIYGAGDLINDYEGISGHERFRGELALLYLPTLRSDGRLLALEMVPMRLQGIRLRRAGPEDTRWLAAQVNRASAPFGVTVDLNRRSTLELRCG